MIRKNYSISIILPVLNEIRSLNKKGKKIMKSMKKQYGKKKGEKIFYASKNKGVIKGVKKGA